MFFVLDDNNNKIEALDKEGVFAVLEQAIEDGSLKNLVANAAFVSKLKCCVSGKTNKIAFVTEAQYNELAAAGALENGVYYYITDDTSIETIDEALTALDEAVVAAENKITAIENGTTRVPKASQATNATNATKVNNLAIKQVDGVLKIGNIIIPQKKVVWEGSAYANDSASAKMQATEDLQEKTLEIEMALTRWPTSKYYAKFRLGTKTAEVSSIIDIFIGNGYDMVRFWLNSNDKSMLCAETHDAEAHGNLSIVITKIYEIIE